MKLPAFLKKTVVALDRDFAGTGEAIALIRQLKPLAPAGVKIGFQAFTRLGPELVRAALDEGTKVFLDLKLHDIPNTVAGAVTSAAELGITWLTVHASGGEAMLKKATEAAKKAGKTRPKILAVTVLTSEEASTKEVVSRAKLAAACGCDGVIASVWEAKAIRQSTPDGFLIVTPGIRFAGGRTDDQKRVATPDEALKAGADLLVIGRPILELPDPEAFFRSYP